MEMTQKKQISLNLTWKLCDISGSDLVTDKKGLVYNCRGKMYLIFEGFFPAEIIPLGSILNTSGCNLSWLRTRHLLVRYLETIRPHFNILSWSHGEHLCTLISLPSFLRVVHASVYPLISLLFPITYLPYWNLFILFFFALTLQLLFYYLTLQLLLLSHLHSLFSSSSSSRVDVFYGWKLLFHSAATRLLSVIFHSSEQLKRNTGFLGDN